jgi:hypothetical protein
VAHARLWWRTGNVFVSDRHPGPWGATGRSPSAWRKTATPRSTGSTPGPGRAAAEIIQELEDSDYGSHGFGLRDPEGNLWAIGTHDRRSARRRPGERSLMTG